jgi:hypothetical protein
LRRLRLWVRPITISILIGLILGILEEPKTSVSSDGQLISIPFGQWLGSVIHSALILAVLGIIIEGIMFLIHTLRRK